MVINNGNKLCITKTYIAQYHNILMTGRQKLFTGRYKCHSYYVKKYTVTDTPDMEYP